MLLNRTLGKPDSAVQETAKPYSAKLYSAKPQPAKPESDKTGNRNLLNQNYEIHSGQTKQIFDQNTETETRFPGKAEILAETKIALFFLILAIKGCFGS